MVKSFQAEIINIIMAVEGVPQDRQPFQGIQHLQGDLVALHFHTRQAALFVRRNFALIDDVAPTPNNYEQMLVIRNEELGLPWILRQTLRADNNPAEHMV
jgi:hypothetical protein